MYRKANPSIRLIPIPKLLISKLKTFQTHDSSYILTNTKKYIEPRIYQRQFKNYLETCEIKDNNFHTLRHTFATNAISKGVDIKSLSAILGHTNVVFTMKKYVHPNIEHRRLQLEKLTVDF